MKTQYDTLSLIAAVIKDYQDDVVSMEQRLSGFNHI